MTPEQAAAYVVAQAALLNAEVAMMVAENAARAARSDSPAYGEPEFAKVLAGYEAWIGHNAICELYRESAP